MTDYQPQGPFANWPRHVFDPEAGLYLWFVEPGAIVTQVDREVLTLPVARKLMLGFDSMREGKLNEIARAGGLFALHDWGMVKTIEPDASNEMSVSVRKTFKRGDVRAVRTKMNLDPFSRIIHSALNVVIRLTVGIPAALVTNLPKEVAERQLQPPKPTQEWSALEARVRAHS